MAEPYPPLPAPAPETDEASASALLTAAQAPREGGLAAKPRAGSEPERRSSPDLSSPDLSDAKKASSDAFVRNTLARLATAAVGIPILLWMLFWAPWWVFPAFCMLAIARAAHELLRMTMVGTPVLYGWGMLASFGLAGALLTSIGIGVGVPQVTEALGGPRMQPGVGGLASVAATILVTVGGVLLPLLHPEPNDRAGVRLAWLVAGPFYVGGLLSSVPSLFLVAAGGWVVLAMGLAWGSDTGAYFAGRFFGKHKLAPTISPSKTVEGAIGGMAASIVVALVATQWFVPSLPVAHAVPLAVAANVLGQCGDLVESLIKRSTGVKDSGSILPGHGGLLDRIDALMFTATACLLYRLIVG
jgi:phosphatidate cytidylyltransferase